jgi:hypothetical protein
MTRMAVEHWATVRLGHVADQEPVLSDSFPGISEPLDKAY